MAAFTSTLRESGDSALGALDKLGFAVDEVEFEGVATWSRPASRGSWGLLALLGVFMAIGLADVESEKESKLWRGAPGDLRGGGLFKLTGSDGGGAMGGDLRRGSRSFFELELPLLLRPDKREWLPPFPP